MRVLVIGATGLIGAALVARLLAEGHPVRAIARRTARAQRSAPQAEWRAFDIAEATRADDWRRHLAGIDAVVNCAGILQDGPQQSTRGVHVDAVRALVAACREEGVRRIVHLSAIGIDRAAPTAFSQTKREGEEALAGSHLDWVILRPSIVLGPEVYGGSALVRGLAALPVLPLMPDTGPLQVVQLEDVVATIRFFLEPGAPARLALDLAGPDALAFADIVARYRRWLGWRDARALPVPRPLAGLLYRLGDVAGRLGWRPPLRSTARHEIARGAIGDPAPWTAMTAIRPQSLDAALAEGPSSVQERWFARLYALKPALFAGLSFYWAATGAISLGPGYRIGVDLMRETGAGRLSGDAVVAGAAADLAVGAAIAWRPTSRRGLYAAIALSAFYLGAGSALLPGRLWRDPLGPLLKILPILLAHLAALAVLEDR
jgi:uncharacterized protein YbjT (DUF2867 family)